MSEFLDTPELQDKVIVRLVDDDKDFLRSMKFNAGNDGLEGSRFFSCSGFPTRRKLQGSRMHRARYADAWDDRFRTSKATY